jgi:hypothetical protein
MTSERGLGGIRSLTSILDGLIQFGPAIWNQGGFEFCVFYCILTLSILKFMEAERGRKKKAHLVHAWNTCNIW